MRHEDVSKIIMLACLNRTLDEWLCDFFFELIEEMELVRNNAMISVLIKPHFFWRLSSQISFETQKREIYDEKLEDALEMLDFEWSKDDDTKTQCNRLNTSPLHRRNASNKNAPARVKQRMQWEAPSKREVLAKIGINWDLDRAIPKGGYVRILAESLLWEERLGKIRIRTTEGLTTCMEPHRGWTIASSSWNF